MFAEWKHWREIISGEGWAFFRFGGYYPNDIEVRTDTLENAKLLLKKLDNPV